MHKTSLLCKYSKYIVCLSTACPNHYRDTSECSYLSKSTRHGTRAEKQAYNTTKYVVSQESSSISDSQFVPNHKKHKRNQLCNDKQTVFKTSKVAINSSEHLMKESKDDRNRPDETHTSISQVKTEDIQRYEKKKDTDEETEILSTGMNEMANRYLSETQEKIASLGEEWDKEEEDKEPHSKEQSSTDGDTQEEEASRSNISFKEALVNEVKESEVEEGGAGAEEEDNGEKGVENEMSRASGRQCKEHDNESDQDGNYNEVFPLGSERNIQDR